MNEGNDPVGSAVFTTSKVYAPNAQLAGNGWNVGIGKLVVTSKAVPTL
jgi:hypothetical protein